jgi:hypothetical protein
VGVVEVRHVLEALFRGTDECHGRNEARRSLKGGGAGGFRHALATVAGGRFRGGAPDEREREPTTTDDTDTDWADSYLEAALGGATTEASAEHGPPPEAADYMDDLTDADLSYLHPDSRADHLETAVDALVQALEGDGVAESARHGRPAAAYRDEERVVVMMEGLGEIINLDRETAALVAFAAGLAPRE